MEMDWPQHLDELRRLVSDEVSYRKIGKRFGCSRQAVAGAVRRHIYGIHDRREPWQQRRRCNGIIRVNSLWSETALTEPWAVRKARRAAEASQ